MTKKAVSLLLLLLLTFAFPFSLSAADEPATKYSVTAESTKIYEKASTSSTVLATAKQGYTCTAIGTTKSFIKMSFKKKNDDTVYEGYIAKEDTDYASVSAAATAPTAPKEKTPAASTNTPPAPAETPAETTTVTYYWVDGGKSHHKSKNCTSLKRSKTIRSGSLDAAKSAGKLDPCNLCAGGK